jgi:7-carboxy-7-deazaguanine synthase
MLSQAPTQVATLRLTEIFYSVQGEGHHAGRPAVFVRAAGCNLACDFCDTDFSLKMRMTPEETAAAVAEYPARYVVLTGGEPTRQPEGLRALTRILQERGYEVALETNGTSLDTLGVNWVTVSPKISQGGAFTLREGDELKLVYEGQDLSPYEDSHFTHYYLQPKEKLTAPFGKGERMVEASAAAMQETFTAVLQNPKWRLSLQLHKVLGVP